MAVRVAADEAGDQDEAVDQATIDQSRTELRVALKHLNKALFVFAIFQKIFEKNANEIERLTLMIAEASFEHSGKS